MLHFNNSIDGGGEPGIMFSRTTEDTELGAEITKCQENMLVVAGSGDQLLDVLCTSPASVTAVDFSANQLKLAQLKLAYSKHLTRENFVDGLGYYGDSDQTAAAGRRKIIFDEVLNSLTNTEKESLMSLAPLIEKGIVDAGSSGVSRRSARKCLYLLKKVMGDKWYKTFIGQVETPTDRNELFFLKLAKTLLINMRGVVAPFMLSPRIVRTSTRAEIAAVYSSSLDRIMDILEYGLVNHPLTSHLVADNFTSCQESALPRFLRADWYSTLQHNANNVQTNFIQADLADPSFWETIETNSFGGAQISSVPAWLDENGRAILFQGLSRTIKPDGVVFCCSHELKSPMSSAMGFAFKEKEFNRMTLVGDRPTNYNHEIAWIVENSLIF